MEKGLCTHGKSLPRQVFGRERVGGLRSFVYVCFCVFVEGCRSLPAWETKTQPGQSLPSGRAGNEKPIPCRVARDWKKIELGPTMADMWTHRKFVSARIPFFFFFSWPVATPYSHRKLESR